MAADTCLRSVLHVRKGAPVKAYGNPNRDEGGCLTFGGDNPVTLMFDSAGELAACEKAIRDFVARSLGAEVVPLFGRSSPDHEPTPPRAA